MHATPHPAALRDDRLTPSRGLRPRPGVVVPRPGVRRSGRTVRNPPASKRGRISISDSPGIGFGQRLTHSMASSIDFTRQIQKPATSSFVSAKGPSVTAAVLARESDPHALRAGLQPVGRQQDARLGQRLVELPHLRDELLAGHHARLAVRTRLDHHHDLHRLASFVVAVLESGPARNRRASRPRTITLSNETARSRRATRILRKNCSHADS